MKDYEKYLIREEKSKENLLVVLDSEGELGNDYKNIDLEICIETEDIDKQYYPIALYVNDKWYDICIWDFIKESLVGVDREIIQYLENDLKDFGIIKDKENYMVFFTDKEVASFDTINECKIYIFDMLNTDRDLDILQFSIYQNLDMKGIK